MTCFWLSKYLIFRQKFSLTNFGFDFMVLVSAKTSIHLHMYQQKTTVRSVFSMKHRKMTRFP